MGITKVPIVNVDTATGESSVQLSVLIYNVFGLPWPIATNRSKALAAIGDELDRMRLTGTEPDVVLLQEAFTPATADLILRAGYPNFVRGPTAKDRSIAGAEPISAELKDFYAARSFWKGEKLGKLLSSGLYAMSNYPIIFTRSVPFGKHNCAGFDCLSNKGVQMIQIQIPGVPGLIEIANTHMNAGAGASGVSAERSTKAHNLQVDDIMSFLRVARDFDYPAIFGGDFNMKQDFERYSFVNQTGNAHVARSYCLLVVDDCEIGVSFDGDEPWMDTQDLQFLRDGEEVKIRPIRIDALFDQPFPGHKPVRGRDTLSDHDGYLVVYRLTWKSK